MKVLMTGYTSFQCNIFRKKNHLYSGASGIAYALDSMDDVEFDVDDVWYDTDISQYDVVIAGFYAPNSLSSYRSLNLVPKLVEYGRSGGVVRMYVDDWHLREMYNGITAHQKRRNITRVAKLQYKAHPDRIEYIMDHVDTIINFYRALDDAPMTLAIPKLPWAIDTAKQNEQMRGRVEFVGFDPSPAFPVIRTNPIADRERAWVLSSRYDFTEWADSLGLQWPVVVYGHKANPDAKLVKHETDLVHEYAQYEGVLSHAYDTDKEMGQWRNRYLFAIWAHTLLGVQPAEVTREIAKLYKTPNEIEQLPPGHRDHLVIGQRIVYDSWAWPLEKLQRWVRGNLLS